MAIGKDRSIGRRLRTLFNVGSVRELTDGQLLERFATGRGETAELAFAVLMERHGPMVRRVCRGVLADPHDAQDAFQATFLVLVRKARGLWVRDSLGPWLHQVALRTAISARSTDARRRRYERFAGTSAPPPGRPVEDLDELGRVLHEEIDRLPERFRAPVVLCDLEGGTHAQAARHLGWPVGTVKSRLSRGRERLRDRIARRGLAPSAGLAVAVPESDGVGESIPPALMESTTRAVVSFVKARDVFPGSAESLALGVLKGMAMTRWLRMAALILLGLTAPGVALLAQKGGGVEARPEKEGGAADDGDIRAEPVNPGKLRVTVTDRGVVEAARVQDVYSQVAGQTTITSILPEGTRVTKGQLVCRLDDAALKDQLINQVITTRGAEAAYRNAGIAREVAEIAVIEYIEGTLKQEQESLKGEIRAAGSGIERGKDRLQRTLDARKRLKEATAAKGDSVAPVDVLAALQMENLVEAAEDGIARAGQALASAKARQDILEKYTKPKTVNGLKSQVEKARSDELAREAAWLLERSKEEKLNRQIVNCQILAPSDGHVVYANDPSRAAGRPTPQIEEGATVRERQKIFSIPELLGPMRVNVKVRESMVDQVAPGQRVRIKVDAFADQTLTGQVEQIAPLPDPIMWSGAGRKVYTTRVKIDKGLPGLRPGMTAEAEILLTERENVLAVPVAAVLRFSKKDHLAVKTPGGTIELRDVTLGVSDGARVEVKRGLKAGEPVVSNPVSLGPVKSVDPGPGPR